MAHCLATCPDRYPAEGRPARAVRSPRDRPVVRAVHPRGRPVRRLKVPNPAALAVYPAGST